MPPLYSGKGAGAAAHLNLKKQAWKSLNSASTQNKHFQNDLINDLWGILSWNKHILGTPETYITYCKKGHNMSPLKLNSLFYTSHSLASGEKHQCTHHNRNWWTASVRSKMWGFDFYRRLWLYPYWQEYWSRRFTHTRQSRVFVVVIEVDPQQEVLQMGLIAFVHQFGHHCKKQA